MVRLGHCNVMAANACTELALPADKVAVFDNEPQFDPDVVAVTCTVAVPGAKLPRLHASVPPAMEHPDGPPGLMLHVNPVGSGSLRIVDVAIPVPLFVAVRVYPTVAPAATVDASATLFKLKFGHCTVIVADNVAVLDSAPQFDPDVVAVT